MIVNILILCVLSCVGFINSASAPFITKCKPDDAKCMKTSAQAAIPVLAAGIPELGVQSLDPFHLKSLDASSPSLKLLLNDVIGTGLKDCVAKKVSVDSAKLKLSIKLQCDVDFKGRYQMEGSLIVLRIEGKGNAHVVLRKILISAEANLAIVNGNDGQPHWTIKNYRHSYELKDQATVELENLFNGNEELGRVAKELIQTSPNEIVMEVGPPIVAAVVKMIAENVNEFFKNVPLSHLVDQ